MEKLEIINSGKVLDVQKSQIDGSTFHMVMANNLLFNDVAMTKCKITNANLSDLEIEGAQLGGAYIHNVGGPPKGHPAYDPAFKQRPLKFEDCNLDSTTITNCNLTGVVITDNNLTGGLISDCNLSNVSIANSNLTGMKINGILVDDLLKAYNQ